MQLLGYCLGPCFEMAVVPKKLGRGLVGRCPRRGRELQRWILRLAECCRRCGIYSDFAAGVFVNVLNSWHGTRMVFHGVVLHSMVFHLIDFDYVIKIVRNLRSLESREEMSYRRAVIQKRLPFLGRSHAEEMSFRGAVTTMLWYVDRLETDPKAYLERRLCELYCAGMLAAVRLHFLFFFCFYFFFGFKLCRSRQKTRSSSNRKWRYSSMTN